MVKKRRIVLWGSFLLLLVAVTFALNLLTGRLLLIESSPPEKVDALYVLASEFQEKNPVAARLYREGFAPRVIIYNDPLFSSWSREQLRNLYQVEWAEEDLVKRGVPRTAIIRLPFAGNGTRYEALSLGRYLRQHPMKRIILIMRDYHARRTLMTFRRLPGATTTFLPVTISSRQTPFQTLKTRMTEAAKIFYYACWLNDSHRFLAPPDRDGSSPGSCTNLPLSLFRSTKPLRVTTSELKNATTGIPYVAGIAIEGGVGPFSMILDEGTLPGGISVNDRFIFKGTPLQPGRYAVTVKVTDGADCTIRKRYSLQVKAGDLSIKTKTAPAGFD